MRLTVFLNLFNSLTSYLEIGWRHIDSTGDVDFERRGQRQTRHCHGNQGLWIKQLYTDDVARACFVDVTTADQMIVDRL